MGSSFKESAIADEPKREDPDIRREVPDVKEPEPKIPRDKDPPEKKSPTTL
jgi:hypothetical protein